MKLGQILKVTSSDYQIRINNAYVFKNYCEKYSDEIEDFDKIVNKLGFKDYDYKEAINNIVEKNPNSFRRIGNEIVLMTTNRDRIINLELVDIRAEGDTIIFIVTYEKYKDSPINEWTL